MSFSFDFGAADYTLDQMEDINNKIQVALTDLDSYNANQLAEWTGGAQEHYYGAKVRWDAAAGRMAAALNQARATLANISGGYGSADRSGAGVWQQNSPQ